RPHADLSRRVSARMIEVAIGRSWEPVGPCQDFTGPPWAAARGCRIGPRLFDAPIAGNLW
ncbi:MAG TPA: hypothetical protein VMU89_00490, partial [Thermomicrobiaceae bacterium]|nr:hypothetical protein [Thermomicrobiaceae bacterium]